jgi:hypothetical protein
MHISVCTYTHALTPILIDADPSDFFYLWETPDALPDVLTDVIGEEPELGLGGPHPGPAEIDVFGLLHAELNNILGG